MRVVYSTYGKYILRICGVYKFHMRSAVIVMKKTIENGHLQANH